MLKKQPLLFVSHGAPSLLIDEDETTTFFQSLGHRLEKPEYILSISAHWQTITTTVTGHIQPSTIHDFYGFQDELYDMTYACPGSEKFAEKVKQILNSNSIDCEIDFDRGLDHGTWVPLKLMFPEAGDSWNKKILGLIEAGDRDALLQACPDYAAEAKPDMGFKQLAFILGALGDNYAGATTHAYEPIYGTGAAVIEFKLGT